MGFQAGIKHLLLKMERLGKNHSLSIAVSFLNEKPIGRTNTS